MLHKLSFLFLDFARIFITEAQIMIIKPKFESYANVC